jgi:hypothetical protein
MTLPLYIRAGVIPEKYRLDALPIAIVSINALDCVLHTDGGA